MIGTLTDHLEVAQLTEHRICVDLAHVPAGVCAVHAADAEGPDPAVWLAQRNLVVTRDEVATDRQDCLRVHLDPGHLKGRGRAVDGAEGRQW